jgi:hypothetical protein
MIYGPYTKDGARFWYGIYLDALVLGSTDKETARKLVNYFETYLK